MRGQSSPESVLIVGGGISGLTVAWFLHQRGVPVTVLEAGAEPGGTIRTVERDGFIVDVGTTSTLYRAGALGEIIRGLGIEPEVIEADRRARRYIVKHGRLVPLPTGPLSVITTPLFSPAAKLRLLAEPFHRRALHEESIAAFVRRRLGPEFLDWAVDPFVSGVYAGDPEQLSVRAASARLYALEAQYGSLFLGALRRAFAGNDGAPQPRGRLISFKRGMQTLPRLMATALRDRIQVNALAMSIARESNQWVVRTTSAEYRAKRLVLALPAYRAGALLAELAPAAARELEAVAYPPVATVALGFARSQVVHALDGFGALLPQRAGRETLGVIFSSTLFPGRAPPDKVLLTAFLGGARNSAVRDYTSARLFDTVLSDLRPLLGLRGDPEFRYAELWPQAIPQYELGHGQRLARLDAAVARLPELYLRANWRDGVSLGDSIASAQRLAGLLAPAD